MQVLVACEYSGVVRDAFIRAGHDAMSCDLLPCDPGSENPDLHWRGNALEIIWAGWDLMIAHPPCTYLSASGLHWNNKVPGRADKTKWALQFVQALMSAPIHKICIENPVGCISTKIRKPDQYIQPHEYGHDASKKTGLWLKGLDRLVPSKHIDPRIVGGRRRWANQTDSGQNRLGPSDDRWKIRSTTYRGIAEAMAHQWGSHESI